VVPQNYFDPLPWHAAWDSARILLNRGLGMDYPGTLAVRRAAFLSAGCYDGDVLFENLELMRTLRSDGARLGSRPARSGPATPAGHPPFRRPAGPPSLRQPRPATAAGHRAGAAAGRRARHRDQALPAACRSHRHICCARGGWPATARRNGGVPLVPFAASPCLAGRTVSLQLACYGLPAPRRRPLQGRAAVPRRHSREDAPLSRGCLERGQGPGISSEHVIPHKTTSALTRRTGTAPRAADRAGYRRRPASRIVDSAIDPVRPSGQDLEQPLVVA
jgi:hypothetical protein